MIVAFFTDPLLRAPLWGTLLMSLSCSLMGAVAFLQRRTLLGEVLSHAIYPGIVLSLGLLGLFFPSREGLALYVCFGGAFIFAIAALRFIERAEKKWKMHSDAALCFVLSFFFGLGLLGASRMQSVLPLWYRQMEMYLYGQAATLQDAHIFFYAGLALLQLLFFCLYFRPLQALLFDPVFSKQSGISDRWIGWILLFFLTISIMAGARSVGIVLMSGMLIAPAVAARQWTERLGPFFILSASIGMASSLIGNFLSWKLSNALNLSFPTGPMIISVACLLTLLSLLLAPKRGWLFCRLRIFRFKKKCLEENLMKSIWKKGEMPRDKVPTSLLKKLQRAGWVAQKIDRIALTTEGKIKAARIVRLHRLWELYLSHCLGTKVERVHGNAEYMEHILTPEIENQLTHLLDNPSLDPHAQPIPKAPT